MKLSVEGMTCHHCSARVKKVIEKFSGVRATEVDLENRQATFSCDDEAVVADIVSALSEFGYTASEKA